MVTTGFSILLRIICTVVGIVLTGGGLRALRTAKKEAYDADTLKVNIWAAVIMIVSGILLFIYGFLWVFRIFRSLIYS